MDANEQKETDFDALIAGDRALFYDNFGCFQEELFELLYSLNDVRASHPFQLMLSLGGFLHYIRIGAFRLLTRYAKK